MADIRQPDSIERDIAELKRRISALERVTPESIAFSDGTRIRVQIGKQADGSYGMKVWNSSGVLTINSTTT